MEDAIVPQAGDVWELDGARCFVTDDGGWVDRPGIMGTVNSSMSRDWFATAKRVFPPVAPGDVIQRSCVVVKDRLNYVTVHDLCGESVAQWLERHGVVVIATVTINVPRSLLSPAVLPDVTASE